jgi:hypothetical protein
MASTIQIKRGTGSAVPTGLSDGELAINLDSGKLYFGSGSTSVDNFTFGELTAEKYIVSSSVLYVTTSFSSGSTEFGNSADDTHTFTGAITASGNISASGTIIGGDITTSGNISSSATIYANQVRAVSFTSINGSIIASNTSGLSTTLGNDSDATTIQGTQLNFSAGPITTAETLISTNYISATSITASGNISASGNIIGPNLIADSASFSTRVTLNDAKVTNSDQDLSALALKTQISGSFFAPSASFSTRVTLNDAKVTNSDQSLVHLAVTSSNVLFGHITSSGNISASGDVYANNFTAQGHTIGTYNSTLIGLGYENNTPIWIGKNANQITMAGHVTASGDISSSGEVITNTLRLTPGANDYVVSTGTSVNIKSADESIILIGHITASGNISASGDDYVFGNVTIDSGKTFIGNTTDESTSQDLLTVGGTSGASIKLYSKHTGINRDVGLHMSASENGQEYSIGLARARNTFYISPSDALSGPENAVFEIDAVGNITASGNISSSGTITANAFVGDITGDVTGQAATVATIAGLAPNTATTQAAQTNITSVGTLSALTVSGDITANGDIVGDDTTDITNMRYIYADRFVADGDNTTSVQPSVGNVTISAGGTTVFSSTVTGSKVENVHQTIYNTGSVALAANSAMGDIVKFGGTTTTAGGIYFLNSSGGWTLTQANAAATSTGSLAVAVGTNSTTHGMCLRGFVNPFLDPGAGIGAPVYLSDTHNGRLLAAPPSSTGDVVRIVGYQYGTDLIYFNPSNDFIIHA